MRPAPKPVLSRIFALFLLVPVLHCGGGASSETRSQPTAGAQADAPEPEEDQNWSHWRWKGKRQACFFRHRNHCYDRLEAACRAARCAESKCTHNQAAPAVVTCRK